MSKFKGKETIEEGAERYINLLAKDCKDDWINKEAGKMQKEHFINGAKWQQEQINCELSELLEENQQLKKWKEEAMTVFSQTDLQKIGKLLNIKLGTSISEQLLPKLIELLEQNKEMLAMLEELRRRKEIIQSEPSGIVRETMIDNFFIDYDLEQLIKEVKDNE